MSYYSSDSEPYLANEDKIEQLFRFDSSLIRSIEALNDWKQHLKQPPLEYLNNESEVLTDRHSVFSSGLQVRALAFVTVIAKGFDQLHLKYKQVYSQVNTDLTATVKQLDAELLVLVRYLQQAEGRSFLPLWLELEGQGVGKLYNNLQRCVDFCLDLNTLWLAMLTPRMFREQNKGAMYKTNYGGTLLFYQKQLSYLQDRIKKSQLHSLNIHPTTIPQLLQSIGLVASSQKLKPNLKSKVISLLKGQHYATMPKTLKEEFIVSSLQMYHGQQMAQIWDYQCYEQLCMKTLKLALHKPQYIDCMLYMEPENIQPEQRKFTQEFADIYYALICRIIGLADESYKGSDGLDIPLTFLQTILRPHNAQLIGHILVNFLLSNKNAFSFNSPELDRPLFGLLDGVKSVYLSFGTKHWLMPSSVLSAFTHRFFSKFSENLKPDIVRALPMMVINLGEGVLPTLPIIHPHENKLQVTTQQVSRSEHLLSIFYFIKDAEDKDQDFYLDLPQVTPTNFQTSLLFVRTLELKLKHHEPTQDQKKLWNMIIEQCISQYRIRVDLKWFQPSTKLDIIQRQCQFMFHKEVQPQWAFQLLQQILNFRDGRKFTTFVEQSTTKDISIDNDIIPYFKYAVGMDADVSQLAILLQEDQLFALLDRMSNLLDIGLSDIVALTPEEKVIINQLHLCLKLYNTKLREAQGNEVYMRIVQNIIVPWMQSNNLQACNKLKTKFPMFFMGFTISESYMAIGDALINLLASGSSSDENSINKIQFLKEASMPNLENTPVESNAELLLRLCSITTTEMSVKVLMQLTRLIMQFTHEQPALKQYITAGYIVDLLMDPSNFNQFFKELFYLEGNEHAGLILQLFQKIPTAFNQLTIQQINQVLKGYVDSEEDGEQPQRLIQTLNKVPQGRNSLILAILKAMVGQRDRQRAKQQSSKQPTQPNKSQAEQSQKQCERYWKELDDYIEQNPNLQNTDESLVSLGLVTQAFEESVLRKLKEDYKKMVQVENKKKVLLKRKSTMEKVKSHKQESGKSEENNSQKKGEKEGKDSNQTVEQNIKPVDNAHAKQAVQEPIPSVSPDTKQPSLIPQQSIQQQPWMRRPLIWRKVVRNYGTFQDTILFGEDPFQIGGYNQQQVYKQCLKVIQQKSIQQKYLKRIIRKLPILKKCAQDTVIQLQQQAQNKPGSIQPQILCKLIMINSRYRSNMVEQFILDNLAKIPISIQIYQSYLALDIKKKLQNIPKDYIRAMLYENIDEPTLKSIDQVFDQIVYMPIQKFEGIPVHVDTIIEQKDGNNQQWQTQSEGQDQEDQNPRAPISKKPRKEENEGDWQDQQQDQGSQNSQSLGFNGPLVQQQLQMGQQQQSQSKIALMFNQDKTALQNYKHFIKLREQINIAFKDNYLELQPLKKLAKQDPVLDKKLSEIVNIIENNFTEADIRIEILNKIPKNLYILLREHGLTKPQNKQAIDRYRKQKTGMPHFIKDYMSDRDDNSDDADNDEFSEQGYLNEDSDELSEQSDSIADVADLFADAFVLGIGQDGQLAQINVAQLMRGVDLDGDIDEEQEQPFSEQAKVAQKLEQDAQQVFTLPNLKQINSQIQSQLTGKQLDSQDMAKIIEISIIKLFSLRSYQLKNKPVLEFYKQLINSKQGPAFIDTLFTVLRVDEVYTDEQRIELAKRLHKLQLSLTTALSNILQIAYDIASEDTPEGHKFCKLLKSQSQTFLPVGDQILIKSKIPPMQDKFLTLLIFYSRFSQSNIHDKAKRLISSINAGNPKSYPLSRNKAALLTKHIYKNNNYSSIWNTLQQNFGVDIDMNTKFSSCLAVYGKMLRLDVEKCYQNLLETIGQKGAEGHLGEGGHKDEHNDEQKGDHNDEQKDGHEQKDNQIKEPQTSDQNPPSPSPSSPSSHSSSQLKQQQKKVQQNLRQHFRRIKHYYYWNKRNIIQQLDKLDNKPTSLLRQQQLIKLTQLMIFYCHFIKKQFYGKIDDKSMRNLLVLPKSVIQTSFMFLWKLQAKIDDWKPLRQVKQYFQAYTLYQHKFTRLEQVCNLILQFLDLPEFSNSKFKQIIIPYFISHPQNAHDIPLMFKLPEEQLGGQKLFLNRECSFDMAFYQLMANSFTIEFHNEEGSDHGGMVRELMMGWTGVGIGEQHVFIGKLLAFSFRKSVPYGGHFDLAMAIAITQFQVTVQFIAEVDHEVYKSLKYIQQSDPQDLGLHFQITREIMGQIRHFPLKNGGQSLPVTNANKQQYLQLFLQKYFIIGREWQMSQICTGFFSSVNPKYAAIFHPLQMIQKIQGEQINDYTKLMAKTKYAQGYTQSSQTIKWFWQVVANFDQKQMNRFLQFITGAPKVSIYNHGFSFVVEKPYAEDQSRLPVAHTCFNTLELPDYRTKDILEKKLRQAIFQGNDNFGIL